MVRAALKALHNPATAAGTARWVVLGMAAYDIAARGASPWNMAALLILGGLAEALRFWPQGPGGPGPSAPAPLAP